jgi:hypothetical protein
MRRRNGEKIQPVIGLIGYASLHGLAALNAADELKSGSNFPDVPVVITSLVEFFNGLLEYNIEDSCSCRTTPLCPCIFQKGKNNSFPIPMRFSSWQKCRQEQA